jgi:homoserine O-acetyltransferase
MGLHRRIFTVFLFSFLSSFSFAQMVVPFHEDYFVIKNFKFSDGQSVDSIKLHYYYLGEPHTNQQGNIDNAVLIMHGTGGSGASLLSENFAGQLFKDGQILDANKYFIILPDALGHGKSSKPSDGLRMRFPAYTYDDMVDADYLLLTKQLNVQHARLIMGTSMGAMHTWVFGYRYPDFMDALMPLACLPIEIAGRNRIFRKMIIDAIKDDPTWDNGNYIQQPAVGMKHALNILMIMSSTPLQWQKDYPTKKSAEDYLNRYLTNAAKGKDANDLIYQVDASREYNPAPYLSKIKAPLLAINSADDQINPPELKVVDTAILRVPKGKFILLPITPETRGHGTHSLPKIWGNYLKEFLEETKK